MVVTLESEASEDQIPHFRPSTTILLIVATKSLTAVNMVPMEHLTTTLVVVTQSDVVVSVSILKNRPSGRKLVLEG